MSEGVKVGGCAGEMVYDQEARTRKRKWMFDLVMKSINMFKVLELKK